MTVAAVALGMTTPQKLSAARPYVIVAAFVVGMLLTPPDVISQTLLAIPVWLLYELGILCSRLVAKRAPPAPDGAPEARFQPLTEAEMDAELDAAGEAPEAPRKPAPKADD